VRDAATRLVPRLVAICTGTWAVAYGITAAFAPRLLLLSPRVRDDTMPLGAFVAIVNLAAVIGVTLLQARRLAPARRALAEGSDAVDPKDLLVLYALPARVASTQVASAAIAAAVTLARQVRPASVSPSGQAAWALLVLTMVSASTLPLYVMLRASVARVLELAPVAIAREAIALRTSVPQAVPRVRTRFLAAVMGPVAFVALGASLLVNAHARAFDEASRERTAADLARVAFDRVHGSESGRDRAIGAAELLGYRAEIAREPAEASVARSEGRETAVTVPLEDGYAVVRYEPPPWSSVVIVYVVIAAIAVAAAGVVGGRIGSRFAADLELAILSVQATGADDVARGGRIVQEPRFQSVSDLMRAIDDLGGVFREFASAHAEATVARAGTERMRGLFLASMSHDLKAPLNAVLGFAALVAKHPLTDGQKESLAIIEQRGRELLALVQTILDSARVEAGELELSPDWTVIGDVVMSAVLDGRDLSSGSAVQVIGEVQPGLPKMRIDATRMVQALTAVVLSAVRFTDDGEVHVRATLPAPGDRLRIDVETSGRGAQTAEREKIFDAFRYADRARRHGSLGLGLALARSIIELHQGSIGVDTLKEGGMVFHVLLPMPEEAIPPPSSRASYRPRIT